MRSRFVAAVAVVAACMACADIPNRPGRVSQIPDPFRIAALTGMTPINPALYAGPPNPDPDFCRDGCPASMVLRPDDDGAFTLKASAQYTFAMMVDAPPVPGSVEYTLMVSPEWSVAPTTVVTMNRTGRFSVSLPLSTPAAPPPPSPNFGVEIEVEYLDAEVRGIQIPLVSFYVRLRP